MGLQLPGAWLCLCKLESSRVVAGAPRIISPGTNAPPAPWGRARFSREGAGGPAALSLCAVGGDAWRRGSPGQRREMGTPIASCDTSPTGVRETRCEAERRSSGEKGGFPSLRASCVLGAEPVRPHWIPQLGVLLKPPLTHGATEDPVCGGGAGGYSHSPRPHPCI